ncbi:Zeaxanthin epoxidase, chloroplastic [Coccomyxa sp. Obi]|nr:Zeaxanthin epoxidase, chloroplastic [Coccomyxa sp. Obi]
MLDRLQQREQPAVLGVSCSATATAPSKELVPSVSRGNDLPNTKPRILIAGAGIGGLVLAVGLLNKGFEVQMFERDLTAIRGEGKYRGPIQIQSNALAALEALDRQVAEEVLAAGCITGDRINGLCDGETGKWYVKFDTFHPAVNKGLPVTRVVSRVELQEILARATERIAGTSIIQNDCHVVDYEERVDASGQKVVTAILEDGRRFEGDILIGADGIWSKVRRKLVGKTQPSYSQYTCYTGIADFTPPDIDTVGYRVFLGNGKYFVSSDVGGGKMQWYGFHKEPAGGEDPEGGKKARLLQIFGHWTDMVTDLIRATPEEDVIRRDIYDRPPIFKWTEGRVALLGDSAHAMQPNLGQGGCMAIEDGYQLAVDLSEAVEKAETSGRPLDIEGVLKGYFNKRLGRASTIHGLAGMAAIMASTYKAYLGEGLGPLEFIKQLKIPHPGRVGGYFAMNLMMPTMLGWVLGGNTGALRGADRAPHCRVNDKPKAFHEQDFWRFLSDDMALLRAARAKWTLVPSASVEAAAQAHSDSIDAAQNGQRHRFGLRIAYPEAATEISSEGVLIGSGADADLRLESPVVAEAHARLHNNPAGGYTVEDLASPSGTFLNGRRLAPNQATQVCPGDELCFGCKETEAVRYRVKMVHQSVVEQLSSNGSVSGNGLSKGKQSDPERELIAA